MLEGVGSKFACICISRNLPKYWDPRNMGPRSDGLDSFPRLLILSMMRVRAFRCSYLISLLRIFDV